jgi:putative ABC transport system permease protein
MCQSARKQIAWYFALPIGVAIVSSFFGIKAMLGGLLPSAYESNSKSLLIMAIVMVGFLFIIECIYMISVMKISDKHIEALNK